MVSNVYRITRYRRDEDGKRYGEPVQHLVYTDSLMETYKEMNRTARLLLVLKIEEFVVGDTWRVIWTPNYED